MDRWVAVFRVLFTTLVNENFKISFQKMTWMKASGQKNLAIGRIKRQPSEEVNAYYFNA